MICMICNKTMQKYLVMRGVCLHKSQLKLLLSEANDHQEAVDSEQRS